MLKPADQQVTMEKMNDCVEVIRDILDKFTSESEAFLCPMYILVASGMEQVISEIGEKILNNDKISGSTVLRLIANSFMQHTLKLSDSLDKLEIQRDKKQEKSHNEQLTEKLLKEAGLQ